MSTLFNLSAIKVKDGLTSGGSRSNPTSGLTTVSTTLYTLAADEYAYVSASISGTTLAQTSGDNGKTAWVGLTFSGNKVISAEAVLGVSASWTRQNDSGFSIVAGPGTVIAITSTRSSITSGAYSATYRVTICVFKNHT